MIDFWSDEVPGGTTLKVPVVVINDLDKDWAGPLLLALCPLNGTAPGPCVQAKVPALGREVFTFEVSVPAEPGKYQLVAEFRDATGQVVRSLRDFSVPGKSVPGK
jgi:hypothetical protein